VRLTPDHDALDVANKVGHLFVCVCSTYIYRLADWIHLKFVGGDYTFRDVVFALYVHCHPCNILQTDYEKALGLGLGLREH
jgi:hypothetical protein